MLFWKRRNARLQSETKPGNDIRHFPFHFPVFPANPDFSGVFAFRHFPNHFPEKNLATLGTMNSPRTRRLARHYLAAVDKVLLALDRAKELRAALRRELGKRKPRGRRESATE
jgi:hypothetical protein